MSIQPRIEALWPEVRDALRPERDTVGTIRLQPSGPSELRVRISQPEGMERALELVRGPRAARGLADRRGVDGSGGDRREGGISS